MLQWIWLCFAHIFTCFDWIGDNFLHSSLYRPVIWICVGNRADNTEMFPLLQSCTYTEPRSFLHLTSLQQKSGGAQEGGREHSQESWSKMSKGTSHTIYCQAGNTTKGKVGMGSHCSGTSSGSVDWCWAAVFINITCLPWGLFPLFSFIFVKVLLSLALLCLFFLLLITIYFI